jgi:hypothetical protein
MAIHRLVTADMPNCMSEVSIGDAALVTRSSNWARTGTYSYRLTGSSASGKSLTIGTGFTSDVIYARFAIRIETMPSSTGGYGVRMIFAEGATGHAALYLLNNGSIQIQRGLGITGSAVGTVIGNLTKTLGVGQSCVFEVYLKVHATEGAVTVKVDGIVDTVLTNVNTRNGATGVVNNLTLCGVFSSGIHYIDDIAFADDWPGTFGNYVFWPNGAGDNADWSASSGNPWECVNKDADGVGDFADYITDNTNSGKHDFAVENLPFTPAALGAVLVIGAGRVPSGSGTARVYAVSGAETASSDDTALSSDPVNMKRLLLVDPNTNAPWTAAGINELKIGVESRS